MKQDPRRALRDRIRSNLRTFDPVASKEDGSAAAVAIALLRGNDGETALPLFLRSESLARHSRQMGLPGGRVEAGEDAQAAALRELHEELGVAAGPDSVLGMLDDFVTRSGFVITPVVVWSAAHVHSLRPEGGGEIARLYSVSLPELERAAASAPPGATADFCLPFVWGDVYAPTAAILFQFNEVAVHGREARVRDFYQPPFTWR